MFFTLYGATRERKGKGALVRFPLRKCAETEKEPQREGPYGDGDGGGGGVKAGRVKKNKKNKQKK